MTLPFSSWQRLGDYLRETQILGSIQSTLYWDQNTSMPSAGATWRGEQLSFLARSLHARQSSEHFEALLQEAKNEFEQKFNTDELDKQQIFERSRNLDLLQKDFERQKSLDPDLIAELAIAKANGYKCWQEAKHKDDFLSFAPALSHLIALRKEEANQLPDRGRCWETLAQPFEPDITINRLNELFTPLRMRLPELIEKSKGIKRKHMHSWDLDEKSQEDLCDRLLSQWSRDTKNSTIARSPHPFSITLGPNDFRITTRVVPGQPLSCFLASAHEWGHSLYEQGLPAQSHQWFAWPVGQATSMGLHESQSLFWENRIARSLPFSERFWPAFAEMGSPFTCPEDLWHEMNPLSPGLNRVEADELTYGLHILIRTDLEIALLEEGLEVEDLPQEWNQRYKELLGISPKNDCEGCLQDVHWSEGAFGYFPSYLLGHLISAQLSETMNNQIKCLGSNSLDSIGECVSTGNESILISWLKKEVHCHGRKMNSEQLVKHVTGKKLSSDFFLNYLELKLDQLMSH
tara:strand:+ start:7577 stop:9130 length:1554 start_codon:yes stop_codon:yes gene_type:complete